MSPSAEAASKWERLKPISSPTQHDGPKFERIRVGLVEFKISSSSWSRPQGNVRPWFIVRLPFEVSFECEYEVRERIRKTRCNQSMWWLETWTARRGRIKYFRFKHLGALRAADNAVTFTLKQMLENKNEEEETRLECAKSLILLGRRFFASIFDERPKREVLDECSPRGVAIERVLLFGQISEIRQHSRQTRYFADDHRRQKRQLYR